MKTYTYDELQAILEAHKKWLFEMDGGKRANLSDADLRGANLSDADLRWANLRGADLRGADLRWANLSRADLSKANLSKADLRWANLRGANLRGANLSDADLSDADLRWADLSWANLSDANLSDADLRWAEGYYMTCPEKGSFIGFKKASGYIVELLIPETAKRSSATTRKCRCSEAIVVSITNVDGSEASVDHVCSDVDSEFIYRVGETVRVDDFDENRFNECAPGIHFFITRQEALYY